MSDQVHEPSLIDLKSWVAEAANDRIRRAQREVTEIILNAVALEKSLQANLVLKGGTLLAVVHGSARQTSDIDFTSKADPEEFIENLADRMDVALDRARARLGHVHLRCRVQGKLRLQPRNFAADSFPSVAMNIAYARAGSSSEKRLEAGQCTDIIPVEISFREPMIEVQEVTLVAANARLEVYSLNEVLAEKFRAYLQQGVRNRRRRQDIYDVAFLIGHHGEAEIDRKKVMQALREKCESRSVPLGLDLIDNPDLIDRAKSEWQTMALEVGFLPPFEECFGVARDFYRSLPWQQE